MRQLNTLILATLIIATIAPLSRATEVVWFSTSSSDPGTAPAGGVNTITYNTLGSQTLYIWTTDGTPVTPGVTYPPQDGSPTPWPTSIPPTSAFFSYNLGVTGTNLGAISLTAGSLSNFNIYSSAGTAFTGDQDWSGIVGPTEFVNRWNAASNFTLAGNPSNVSASSITGLNASSLPVAIDSAGVPNAIMTNIHDGLATPANDSFAGAQPGYNAARHAYLLGQVSFNTNAFNTDGSTILGLNSSTFGLGTGNTVYNGTSWSSVTTDLSADFTLGHATIDVVPEPATWLLLTCGCLGLLGLSRRLHSNS